MQLRFLIGSSALATIALTFAACAGTITDEEDFGDVIGAQAELVQKKREWLTGYDNHCGVCFQAFELCEKGSTDNADATNCEAALNACVRGGLITDGDAGANGADASRQSAASDAATGSDVDAGADPDAESALDAGDVLSVDAGQPDPIGAIDAGRRANSSDASIVPDGGTFSRDAGAGRAGQAVRSGDRSALEQSVDQCLTTTHDCIGTSATVQACVSGLRGCVRAVLEQTFANVCSTQIAACHAQSAAPEATRSVERLCQQDLGLGSNRDR